jgi:hypothetical protein
MTPLWKPSGAIQRKLEQRLPSHFVWKKFFLKKFFFTTLKSLNKKNFEIRNKGKLKGSETVKYRH